MDRAVAEISFLRPDREAILSGRIRFGPFVLPLETAIGRQSISRSALGVGKRQASDEGGQTNPSAVWLKTESQTAGGIFTTDRLTMGLHPLDDSAGGVTLKSIWVKTWKRSHS